MEGIREFWSTGIGKVLIIGIFGGVLLVCVLLGIVLIRDISPESPSEPEQDLSSVIQTQKAAETALAAQPTGTATPTEAPSPTDTPVPDPLTPTGTPLATSTSGTSTDPYLNEVDIRLRNYQSAYSDVNNYFQESTTDASKLLDNNWKQKANMALNQLDNAANQLETIGEAPPEYEELDTDLISLASETHDLVQNYGDGINQLDPSAINQAANNLTDIATYLDSVVQELDQFSP